jgi:hypothetical protein
MLLSVRRTQRQLIAALGKFEPLQESCPAARNPHQPVGHHGADIGELSGPDARAQAASDSRARRSRFASDRRAALLSSRPNVSGKRPVAPVSSRKVTRLPLISPSAT